jgi:Protein of unknown function (DUF2635)
MTDPKTIFVKPAEGMIVIDPETGKTLPVEGDYVPLNKYYRRRMDDQSVIAATAPKTPNKKEK